MSIRLMAIGLAGALTLSAAVSASAGPLPIGNSGLMTATTPATTEIYWRRGYGGYGPGIGFGIAAGALVGAAVASSGYYGYGYGPGPGYYYGGPVVYAQPYAYQPVYPGYYGGGYGYNGYGYNGYGYGRCTTDEGYGRRRPCSGQ